MKDMNQEFIFATGIENSAPTIDNGRTRVDEMEKCKHYIHWRRDLELVEELGINFLRYGAPIYRVFLGAEKFDWDFTDQVFADLRRRRITPIVDLCHFGLPTWLGNFQNEDFPHLFARYAAAFARRFPWIRLYTPINEMYICALFSAYYGWWNEQLASDRAFVTALKHIVKANKLAMREILRLKPDAIFVQSESVEYFHPENPKAIQRANEMNEKRFLSLDLNYGKPLTRGMIEYLMANGVSTDELTFFKSSEFLQHCILGTDYYLTNEHCIKENGNSFASGDSFGYAVIANDYFTRYNIPMIHTETNICEGPQGNEAVKWLWKQWANVMHIRNQGIPVRGFTWYSLTDQVDWDTALRENKGNVNPLGLYDLERNIRPVGRAYKHLISEWNRLMTINDDRLYMELNKENERKVNDIALCTQ